LGYYSKWAPIFQIVGREFADWFDVADIAALNMVCSRTFQIPYHAYSVNLHIITTNLEDQVDIFGMLNTIRDSSDSKHWNNSKYLFIPET
jgi:hypothetical protein